jgi:hypothetical protein
MWVIGLAAPDDNFYGNAGWPVTASGTGTGVLIKKAKDLNPIVDAAGNPDSSLPGHVFGVIDTQNSSCGYSTRHT